MTATGAPSVVLVHERYRTRAGEDAVFDAELRLLREHGHDVRTLVVDNARIDDRSLRRRIRLAAETAWSSRAARLISAELERRPADVVHVHNTFPLLSPSVHVAARRAGAAVVQTVHNYRPVCPAATLYRDGAPCHDCVGRLVAWPSMVHRCYRDSALRTAPVVAMLAVQRLRHTWDAVDAIIVLTAFAGRILAEGGLPPEVMHVKPNFVEDPGHPIGTRDGFLYVGRIAPEKGVDVVVQAAALAPSIRVRIAGDGPDAARLRALSPPNVEWLGSLDHAEALTQIGRARALVFPSRWYEGMPLVLLESFASGTPVIASRLGAAAELVVDGVNGVHAAPGDAAELAAAMERLSADDALVRSLGVGARSTWDAEHRPDQAYARLSGIYAAAVARRTAS